MTNFKKNNIELMKSIPSKSIHMILCDLPYGTTQNAWDNIIDFNLLWEQYRRIIKDNGAIVLFSQGIFTAKLIISNEKEFKYKWIWQKSKATNFLNAKKQPLRKHEEICVFYKKQPIYNPQMTVSTPYNKGIRKGKLTGSYGDFKAVNVKSDGERYPVDIIYSKTAEAEGKVYHSTQKPIALLEYLIKTYTNEFETILDNTMGAGSTGIACINTNRYFIGMELNEDIYLTAKKRIEERLEDI